MRDIDARELGAELLLGDGANGSPDISEVS